MSPNPKHSAEYLALLKSPRWKELRREVFRRDGGCCRSCGRRELLHCHHVHYENVGHESTDDLLALCNDCHSLVHAKGPARDGTYRIERIDRRTSGQKRGDGRRRKKNRALQKKREQREKEGRLAPAGPTFWRDGAHRAISSEI